MNTIFTKLSIAFMLLLITSSANAQLSPISFEPGGNGNTWTWTAFENVTNLPTQIVANPSTNGINVSTNVIKMTTLVGGQPWAGFESLHGAGIGTFTLNSTNCIVKLMVYKSVISDVGVKFATAAGASTGEIKVANTKINQWEELTFNFTPKIGEPSSTNIDQIIIFPDFGARTTDNVCYVDNINLGVQNVPVNINVTFATQNTDSTPVYVFGNWNNWSNFPGTQMLKNNATGIYEVTLPLTAASTIEYLFVNGVGTKEVLNPIWACTNGNAQYTNRLKILGNADITLCNVWKTCNSCIPLSVANFVIENMQVSATQNYFTIQSNQFSSVDKVEIFDIAGNKCYSSNSSIITNRKISINLQSNKIYIIRLQKNNQFINQKIQL